MNDLQDKELNRLVHEALGRASMCWWPAPSDQVFDTPQAEAIGAELVARIKALLAPAPRMNPIHNHMTSYDPESGIAQGTTAPYPIHRHPLVSAPPESDDENVEGHPSRNAKPLLAPAEGIEDTIRVGNRYYKATWESNPENTLRPPLQEHELAPAVITPGVDATVRSAEGSRSPAVFDDSDPNYRIGDRQRNAGDPVPKEHIDRDGKITREGVRFSANPPHDPDNPTQEGRFERGCD